MNQPVDPSTFDPAGLSDPSIEPATLAQLAQFRPDLWDGILNHPQCYPGLGDWIRQNQAAQAGPASEGRSPGAGTSGADQVTSGDSPAEDQPLGDETTVFKPVRSSASAASASAAEPQQGASSARSAASAQHSAAWQQPASAASAPQASPWTQSTQQAEVADQTQAQQQPGSDATAPEGDPSAAQQFGDGAKQIAAGAARGFQNAVDSQAKETGPARLLGWLPLLLAALALLGIGAMFFPSARIGIDLGRDDLPITFPTGSASFYGSSQGHIGIYLVILLAATIVLAVLAFATHKLWARIGAAVVGLASGIVGLVAGFGAASGDKRDFTDAIRNHLESALPGLFKKYSDYFGGMDSEDVPDQIQDFFDDSSAWGMVDIKLGFGAVILGILAILIVIVSVAVAVPPRQVNALAARSAAANQPANGGQTAWGQPAQQSTPTQQGSGAAWPTQQSAWPTQSPAWPTQQPDAPAPGSQQAPAQPGPDQQNPYGPRQSEPQQNPYGQQWQGQNPYGARGNDHEGLPGDEPRD